MSDYTVDEVEAAIRPHLRYGDWDELAYALSHTDTPGLITIRGEEVPVEVIEQEGDGEYGYETHVIFRVGTQIFRKDGYYQSHYGNDWDGAFREVHAVTKTVIVYE